MLTEQDEKYIYFVEVFIPIILENCDQFYYENS